MLVVVNDELGPGEMGVGMGGDGTRPLGGETLGCGADGKNDDDIRRWRSIIGYADE